MSYFAYCPAKGRLLSTRLGDRPGTQCGVAGEGLTAHEWNGMSPPGGQGLPVAIAFPAARTNRAYNRRSVIIC